MIADENEWKKFWNWDYLNAFRMHFSKTNIDRKSSLVRVLREIPNDRARIDYSYDCASEELVVLFTHDMDNDGARYNEAWLLAFLVETQALTFYGTEGASGAFNLSPYRDWVDPEVTQEVAANFLARTSIEPLEYIGLTCRGSVTLWGIEDAPLYLQALEALRSNDNKYYSIISKRPHILIRNLREKMSELSLKVAAAWLTPYNFHSVGDILRASGIPHIGIVSKESGPTVLGRENAKLLRKKAHDRNEMLAQTIFSDTKGFITWMKTVGRSTRRQLGAGVNGTVLVSRRLYWYSKWLEHQRWLTNLIPVVRRRLRHLISGIRYRFVTIKTLSEYTQKSYIGTRNERCVICAELVVIPEVTIVTPINSSMIRDTGGCCVRCQIVVCERHADRLAYKRNGMLYCLGACPQCGGRLSGLSLNGSRVDVTIRLGKGGMVRTTALRSNLATNDHR